MIEDIQDLKEFMEWCIAKGIRSAQVGDVKFEISDYGLTQHLMEIGTQNAPLKDTESTSMTSKTMVDTTPDDEDLMFWSSKA